MVPFILVLLFIMGTSTLFPSINKALNTTQTTVTIFSGQHAKSAITGKYYSLIARIIGAIGTFVTGSDTSANVVFGGLQTVVAKSLHMSPAWLVAANICGATAGKMISPQSIAVATAATGLTGKEGKILNATFKFCLFYIIVLGVISYFKGPIFGF